MKKPHWYKKLKPNFNTLLDRVISERKKLVAPWEKKIFTNYDIPCVKGCTECCYMSVFAFFSEGCVIARRTLKHSMGDLLDQILDHAVEHLEHVKSYSYGTDDYKSEESARAWLAQRRVCPLLDKSTKSCTFYSLRPTACQTHFVIGSGDQCCNLRPDSRVKVPNPSDVMKSMTKLDGWFMHHIGVDTSLYPMPLSYAVALGVKLVEEGKMPSIKVEEKTGGGGETDVSAPVDN